MKKIREGAIFVADSHYPHHGNEFYILLKQIYDEVINPSQIFLMGDNFDLLVGDLKYSHKNNKKAIKLLNQISKNIDIYYLEGNHDFRLKVLFPDINIITRSEQPLKMFLGKKTVGLSHGDKYTIGILHDIMSKAIRSSTFINIITPIQKIIIDKQNQILSCKDICHNMKNFNQKAKEIIKSYSRVDMIVEGHYHQGELYKNYISLPSLACQKQIAVVEDENIIFKSL